MFNYSGSSSLVQIFTFIILLATLTTLVPYAFCAMSELMLLIQHRSEFNRRRLIGSSVIGIVAFIYAVWTVYGSGAQTVLLGLSGVGFLGKEGEKEAARALELL